MSLDSYQSVIVCWHQKGCPACEEFLPRFKKIAKKYRRCVPSEIVDVNENESAANALWVRSTPTTMILHYGRRSPYSLSGSVPDEEVERLYETVLRGMAIRGNACDLEGPPQ